MRRLAIAFILVAAACGESGVATTTAPAATPPVTEDVIAVRASSDLAVGRERLLLALVASDGGQLGSPDLEVAITVWPEEQPSQRQEVMGEWIWAIPDRSGLYRAAVSFDRPGVWFAEMTPASGPVPVPVAFGVNVSPSTPAIGEAAPPSVTPTADGLEAIKLISTDTAPEPRLYELSIDEAVSSGRPTVIAFATPQFCQTAICGPTLEIVKGLVDDYPDVNFVHVEVYDLQASPADPTSIEELVLAPSVIEWGLLSEPWVFVVDADGIVVGRFEGVVEPPEIAALIG